jgi:hypothetical protein
MSTPYARNTRLPSERMSPAQMSPETVHVTPALVTPSPDREVRLSAAPIRSTIEPRTFLAEVAKSYEVTVRLILLDNRPQAKLDLGSSDVVYDLCRQTRPDQVSYQYLPPDFDLPNFTDDTDQEFNKIRDFKKDTGTVDNLQTIHYVVRRTTHSHAFELKLYVQPHKRLSTLLLKVLPIRVKEVLRTFLIMDADLITIKMMEDEAARHGMNKETRETITKFNFISNLGYTHYLVMAAAADRSLHNYKDKAYLEGLRQLVEHYQLEHLLDATYMEDLVELSRFAAINAVNSFKEARGYKTVTLPAPRAPITMSISPLGIEAFSTIESFSYRRPAPARAPEVKLAQPDRRVQQPQPQASTYRQTHIDRIRQDRGREQATIAEASTHQTPPQSIVQVRPTTVLEAAPQVQAPPKVVVSTARRKVSATTTEHVPPFWGPPPKIRRPTVQEEVREEEMQVHLAPQIQAQAPNRPEIIELEPPMRTRVQPSRTKEAVRIAPITLTEEQTTMQFQRTTARPSVTTIPDRSHQIRSSSQLVKRAPSTEHRIKTVCKSRSPIPRIRVSQTQSPIRSLAQLEFIGKRTSRHDVSQVVTPGSLSPSKREIEVARQVETQDEPAGAAIEPQQLQAIAPLFASRLSVRQIRRDKAEDKTQRQKKKLLVSRLNRYRLKKTRAGRLDPRPRRTVKRSLKRRKTVKTPATLPRYIRPGLLDLRDQSMVQLNCEDAEPVERPTVNVELEIFEAEAERFIDTLTNLAATQPRALESLIHRPVPTPLPETPSTTSVPVEPFHLIVVPDEDPEPARVPTPPVPAPPVIVTIEEEEEVEMFTQRRKPKLCPSPAKKKKTAFNKKVLGVIHSKKKDQKGRLYPHPGPTKIEDELDPGGQSVHQQYHPLNAVQKKEPPDLPALRRNKK